MGNDNSSPAAKRLGEAVQAHREAFNNYRTAVEKYDKSLAAFEASRAKQTGGGSQTSNNRPPRPPAVPQALMDHAAASGGWEAHIATMAEGTIAAGDMPVLLDIIRAGLWEELLVPLVRRCKMPEKDIKIESFGADLFSAMFSAAVVGAPTNVGDTLFCSYDRAEALTETVPGPNTTCTEGGTGKEEVEENSLQSSSTKLFAWWKCRFGNSAGTLLGHYLEDQWDHSRTADPIATLQRLLTPFTMDTADIATNNATAEGAAVTAAPNPRSSLTCTCGLGFDLFSPLSIGGYKSASAIHSLFGGSTPSGDRDRHFYFGQQLYGYVLASFLAVYPQSGGTDIRGAEAFLQAQGGPEATPLWYLLTNSYTSERERVALPLISLLLEATITASIQLAHFYQAKTVQTPGPDQPSYLCCDEKANALLAAVNAATARKDASAGERDTAYDHLFFGWRAMMGLAPQCIKTSDPKQIPALLLQCADGSTTTAASAATLSATLSDDLFRLRLVHRRHILGLRAGSRRVLNGAGDDGMNGFLAYLNQSSQTLPGLQLLLLDPTFVPPSLEQTDTTTPYLPPAKNNQRNVSPANYYYYAITLQPRLVEPDAAQQKGSTDIWLERARSGIVRVGPCGTLPDHPGVRAQWGWCRVAAPNTMTAPSTDTKTMDTARVADTEDEQHRLLVEDLLASVDNKGQGPLDIVAQGDESGQSLRMLHYTLSALHKASMKELREQQQQGAAGVVDVRESLLYRHIFGMPSDRGQDQAASKCSKHTAAATPSPFARALVYGNAVSVDMMLTAVYVYARDVGQWLLATSTDNTNTKKTAGEASGSVEQAALREALQCLDALLLRMHYDEEAWALGRVALRCVAAKRWGLGVPTKKESSAAIKEGTILNEDGKSAVAAEEAAATATHLAASLRGALTGLSADISTTPDVSSEKVTSPWINALVPNPLQEIKVAITFAAPSPSASASEQRNGFTISTRTILGIGACQTVEHTAATAPCPSTSGGGDGTPSSGASSASAAAITIEMPLCSLATDFYGVDYNGRGVSLLGPFSQPRRGNMDHSLKEYVSLWDNYEKKSWRLPFGPITNNRNERDPQPTLPTTGDFSGKKTVTEGPHTSTADWCAGAAGAVAAERYAERVVGCPSSASAAMCVAKLLQVSLLVQHLRGEGRAVVAGDKSGADDVKRSRCEACPPLDRVPTFRSLQKLLQSTSNNRSIADAVKATTALAPAERRRELLDVFNCYTSVHQLSSASAARKAFAQTPLGRLELALDNIATELFQMPILTTTTVEGANEGNEGDAGNDAASVRQGPASWRRVIAAAMNAHLPGDAATDACDVRVMRWYKDRIAVVMDKKMWTRGFDDVLSAVVRTLDDALLMLVLAVSTDPTAAARLLGADPDCRYVLPKLEYVMVQAQLLQRYLRGGPLRYYHSESREDKRIQGARDTVRILHRAKATKGQAADPQHTTAATEGANPPPPSAQIIFDSAIDKKYIYYYNKAYFEDDDQCFGFDNPFVDVPASVPAVIPAAFRETLVAYPLRKRFATDIYRLIAAATPTTASDASNSAGTHNNTDPALPVHLSTAVGGGSFAAGHGASLRRVFAALRPVLAAEVSATAAAAAKKRVPAPFPWGALAKGIAVGLFKMAAFFLGRGWLWGTRPAITTSTAQQRKAGVSGPQRPPNAAAIASTAVVAGAAETPLHKATATTAPTVVLSSTQQWVNAVFRRFPPLTTQPLQASNTGDTCNAPPPPPQELDVLINGREDRLWDAVQRLMAASASGEKEASTNATTTASAAPPPPPPSPAAITYEALLTFFETEWHSRAAFAYEMTDL